MRNKYSLLSILVTLIAFTSCLKDQNGGKNLVDAGANSSKVFELAPLPDVSGPIVDRVKNVSFLPSTTPIELVIPVYLSTTSGAYSQDVTVTLQKDTAAITKYNLDHGTTYTFLPATFFTEPSLSVTIPAGTQVGTASLKLKTDLISPTASYAVAYKIIGVPAGAVISGTRMSATYIIAIKNKFDGVYTLKSKMLDWFNNTPGNITNTPFTWPGEIYMITSGANSVNMFDTYAFGAYIHPAVAVTGITGFGSTNPKFTFDAGTNLLTECINDFATPPANGRAFLKNATFTTSRWDPTTGNIYAAIILKQPGRTDLQIFDTLIYVGPRP